MIKLFRIKSHFSDAGNKVVAEYLLELIETHNLLKSHDEKV